MQENDNHIAYLISQNEKKKGLINEEENIQFRQTEWNEESINICMQTE